MSYVDAGYVVAIGGSFVYAVSLVLRRRRWERALRASDAAVAPVAPAAPVEPDAVAGDGERS